MRRFVLIYVDVIMVPYKCIKLFLWVGRDCYIMNTVSMYLISKYIIFGSYQYLMGTMQCQRLRLMYIKQSYLLNQI